VRLTFPENENIQGLRAFTPTDPEDLEKFDELRNAISAESHNNIERLTAVSSEEFDSKEQTTNNGLLLKPRKKVSNIVNNPTRPTRPPKEASRSTLRQGKKADGVGEKPSFSSFSQTEKPSIQRTQQHHSARARQVKKNGSNSHWNKFQRMDQESSVRREEAEEFDISEEVNEIFSGSEINDINTWKPEVKFPVYYPVYEPFRPDEAIPSNKGVKEFLRTGVENDYSKNYKQTNIDYAATKNSVNSTGPSLPPDSLVLYNTSPSPAVYNQPPRPAYPPPARAARSDPSPIQVRHHYWSPQQPHKQQSSPSSNPKPGRNPLAFLIPGAQQDEAKIRQQPRIEVIYI
jgi:hypothetical protein